MASHRMEEGIAVCPLSKGFVSEMYKNSYRLIRKNRLLNFKRATKTLIQLEAEGVNWCNDFWELAKFINAEYDVKHMTRQFYFLVLCASEDQRDTKWQVHSQHLETTTFPLTAE